MATARKSATKTASKRKPTKDPLEGLSTEQIQAAVRAGQELADAGLPVPAKVKQITAAWAKKNSIDPVPERQVIEAEGTMHRTKPKSNTKWIRAVYNAPFSFRWNNDADKRCEINLEPRGQRGDLYPISNKEEEDSAFQHALRDNLNLGLIEIISDKEATEVIDKQTTNQTRVHTPTSILRSETGKEYAPEDIHLASDHVDQGIVVAKLTPSEHSSEIGEITVDRGGINRQLGGNPAIVSDGFAEQRQFVPSPNLAQQKIADDIARRKNIEGPAAAGIQTVSVGPVQRG